MTTLAFGGMLTPNSTAAPSDGGGAGAESIRFFAAAARALRDSKADEPDNFSIITLMPGNGKTDTEIVDTSLSLDIQ